MKNGFFHERPDDYDIYVAKSMVSLVGQASINWHVQNVRLEGFDLYADVAFNGKVYTAIRKDRGADHFWTIVR